MKYITVTLFVLLLTAPLPATTIGTVSPNPVNFRSGDLQTALTVRARTDGIPTTCRIFIYDLTGRLVKEFSRTTAAASDYTENWSCRNSAGRPVFSGIYIVLFIRNGTDGKSEQGKLRLAVLR